MASHRLVGMEDVWCAPATREEVLKAADEQQGNC